MFILGRGGVITESEASVSSVSGSVTCFINYEIFPVLKFKRTEDPGFDKTLLLIVVMQSLLGVEPHGD